MERNNKLQDIKKKIIITYFSVASSDPISSNNCNTFHRLVTHFKISEGVSALTAWRRLCVLDMISASCCLWLKFYTLD